LGEASQVVIWLGVWILNALSAGLTDDRQPRGDDVVISTSSRNTTAGINTFTLGNPGPSAILFPLSWGEINTNYTS
jgi:hypothetical protein